MYLVSSLKETSDSLELIIRIYEYPTGEFLESVAESEVQFRLSDLFAEIEIVLIAAASVRESSYDNRGLAASVKCGVMTSVVGANYTLLLPPLI